MYEYLVVAAVAVGGSLLTTQGIKNGAPMSKYQPPSWVFGVVWTFIYITYALIWERIPMPGWLNIFFFINMVLNLLWVYTFFYLKNVFVSQIIIIGLLGLTLFQAYALWSNSDSKYVTLGVFGLLIYAAWLTTASLLNFNVI